ncbi:MAG: Dabb family protein [Clostridiales bacterium]|uniref:Dabb family protein n=1 Tax=Clostridium sp. N3C TaxID=1776758 RepID=UPI0009447F88|nr:Dabb family protein [Clostridium sp. N3C]NLZ47550.1 Dabb family protein [Clostridiales bacterium]
MIKHIVMWKLKDFSEGKNKLENAQIIKRDLEALKDKIRELKYIEVGININESEQAYDVVLYSEFNSIKDLNTYQNHEEHLKVAGFIRKVVDARIVTDYETNIK